MVTNDIEQRTVVGGDRVEGVKGAALMAGYVLAVNK